MVINVTKRDEIMLGDTMVEYELKKRLKTKYLRLKINEKGILKVSAPRLMSEERIAKFIVEKQEWIKKHVKKMKHREAELSKHMREIKNGEVFMLFGEEYVLQILYTEKKRISAKFYTSLNGENVLKLYVNRTHSANDIKEQGRAVIERLYKRTAKKYFLKRLQEINDTHYNFKYKDVRFKNQKTLYGSCSRKGNLNFNWKVVMAPTDVIDYLLAHELSHLKQMNHSEKFWALVQRARPNYKMERKWLKEKGHTLVF